VTGTRTTIAHLPEIKLKPLLVPVPSPDEQAEIAAAIGTVVQNMQPINESWRHSKTSSAPSFTN